MSYSREEVKAITDKVLNMAKADAVEVRFSGGERSATRYANSTITANLVEHDQEVQITVFYGQKSASTSTHQFDDASLKSAIEQAQELAKRRPDNPELMPPVKPPQDYLRGRRRAAAGGCVRAGRARASGQAERRRLREKGRARRRLHPQAALDRCAGEFRRAVRVLPLCRGELHPDVPDAGWDGLRLGRDDRAERRDEDRRRGVVRSRGRQGAEVAQAARHRTRQLHRHPGTSPCGAPAVADAVRAERAAGGGGPQLHERSRARDHEARSEDLRRERHDSQRRRQSDPAADADWPRRPRLAADHLGREGRRQKPVLRPVLGEEAEQGVHADRAAAEPRHGRRRRHASIRWSSRPSAVC